MDIRLIFDATFGSMIADFSKLILSADIMDSRLCFEEKNFVWLFGVSVFWSWEPEHARTLGAATHVLPSLVGWLQEIITARSDGRLALGRSTRGIILDRFTKGHCSLWTSLRRRAGAQDRIGGCLHYSHGNNVCCIVNAVLSGTYCECMLRGFALEQWDHYDRYLCPCINASCHISHYRHLNDYW
jgi:hypothetical protein